MFRALRSWLNTRALRRASAERAVALAKFRSALARGDTRAQASTYRPAVLSTCAELEACLRRAPSNWRGR